MHSWRSKARSRLRLAPISAAPCAQGGDTPPTRRATARAIGQVATSSRRWGTPPGWSISGGGGGAWFSDRNRRYSAVGAVLARVARGLQLGPYARILGYRDAPGGYFAPDRFSVIEGRAVYVGQRNRWGLRADGGVGSQQVFKGATRQTEWHIGLSLSRGWGANNEIALVGSITDSAAATPL